MAENKPHVHMHNFKTEWTDTPSKVFINIGIDIIHAHTHPFTHGSGTIMEQDVESKGKRMG